MTSTAPSARRLVDDLLALIDERAPADRATALRDFARAYVRRISTEVLETLGADELYGQIAGIFALADGRGSRPFVVRAFNPTAAGDGYSTAGTVVETNCEDSPFLVDSVSEELVARGLDVRVVIHPVVGTERGADGRIARVLHARDAPTRESVMHFEVDRRLPPSELEDLERSLAGILADVQAAVRDFREMTERVPRMVEAARAAGARYEEDEIEETELFLRWLLDGNFVFLGYREYAIADGALSVVPGSGLGLLADDEGSRFARPVPLDSIDPGLRERLLSGGILVHSKTNAFSTVHRHVKMDDVTVKRIGPDGSTTGALRLLGLFTSKAYMSPASRIPILSRKLRQIAAAEDFLEGSHDFKSIVALYEAFPKDELFAASPEELRRTLVRLLDLRERRHVELFVRPDIEERRVGILVALPRDRFNAELRNRLQQLFVERFHGSWVEYHLSLGDSDRALLHFTVHVDREIPEVSFAELEQEVTALARTWDDELRERLVSMHGEARGNALADRYGPRFPDYYKAASDVDAAVLDIAQLERLDAGEPFAVGLKNEHGPGQSLTRVGLYKTGGKVLLSDFLPILSALGLTVVEEVPTRLLGGDGETFIHDFGVLGTDGRPLDLAESGERVAETIAAVWRGQAESDSLNRLVVSAGLTWRQVVILRAYRTYRLRTGASFGAPYKDEALSRNPEIVRKLVALFELRFDPARPRDEAAETALREEILADLDRVKSLDEDRILRAQLALVDATVRTNAFLDRPYLSFKFDSARVPDLPKPHPVYEIFVYSPEMEGVHLRGGKVARGGIRWSDRREDYRTEVLGLMKAQMVKNALIVPVGSKGGFVLKRSPATREELQAEVAAQYSTLIRGLLDLTDNRVGDEVVHPPGVRVLDDDDPYLVVAADKGTAALSDTANAIALEYGFWLGDAFASGGSDGYDHKKLGITARGVWESVKRHFRELGLDVETTPFTVVGIGDMSGDVFGNGMLLSRQIRLVAAFDHRHVFVDPDPDPDRSFDERRRLFELGPGSSWDDYDRSLVSPGGGVWARTEKSIPLSPQAQEALGVDAEALTPNALVSAILRAPVDLLYNGGIGTFVKASHESNALVGDRTNDAIRVSGSELRARVVAEGGNLGLTQKARIEYANAGGRINTDAIDNSAGVDCSDHEVNLKILLGMAIESGELTREARNELLREVESDVAAQVLYDNYLQAQILSQEVAASAERLDAYEDLMAQLEAKGLLDRELESLPTSEQIAERRAAGQGMARPELCILLAYAKRSIKEEIRSSSLPDDPYLDSDLRGYFPPAVAERFGSLIARHPLRRDLAATILANAIVDDQGITFVSRLASETGAEPAQVARAHRIAREVTGAWERWEDVESLDGKIDPVVQNELMVGVDTLVDDVSRWFLQNEPGAPLGTTIAKMRPAVAEIARLLDTVGSDEWRRTRLAVAESLVAQGVPEAVARRHAFQPELAHAPDMISVAQVTGRDVAVVAATFFLAGERVGLDWLERRLADVPASTRYDRWAVRAMGDDLMTLRRDLALRILGQGGPDDAESALARFLATRSEAVERLDRLIEELAPQSASLAALTVALRQVRSVVG